MSDTYRLDRWRLEGSQLDDGDYMFVAWGNVYGNPTFSNGYYIHTSPIELTELSEDALTVVTESGSVYELPFSGFNTEVEQDTKTYRAAGIDAALMKKICARSHREVTRRQKEVGGRIGPNELYLEVAGCTSVADAWFKDENGATHRINPSCHVGMFQDSWLMMGPGMVDFRLFPEAFGWEPYHVSDNIERVHFYNTSNQDVGLRVHRNEINLTAGEITVVERAFLQDAEGLVSPDCYNGKSMLNERDGHKEEMQNI